MEDLQESERRELIRWSLGAGGSVTIVGRDGNAYVFQTTGADSGIGIVV